MVEDGAEDVVALARRWIGTPYVHQASRIGAGCDCLGLIRGIWRERHGDEPEVPPPYSADWGECGGRELLHQAALRHLLPVAPETALAGGQVLLFRMRTGSVAKHLGIVARVEGGPSFIHAYNRRGVVESPLSAPWRLRIAARFEFP